MTTSVLETKNCAIWLHSGGTPEEFDRRAALVDEEYKELQEQGAVSESNSREVVEAYVFLFIKYGLMGVEILA